MATRFTLKEDFWNQEKMNLFKTTNLSELTEFSHYYFWSMNIGSSTSGGPNDPTDKHLFKINVNKTRKISAGAVPVFLLLNVNKHLTRWRNFGKSGNPIKLSSINSLNPCLSSIQLWCSSFDRDIVTFFMTMRLRKYKSVLLKWFYRV